MTEMELEDFHDPDGYLDRDDEYMKMVGFYCFMCGKEPYEIFENPDWPKHIIFGLKVSNIFWKEYITVMKNGSQ